MLEMIVGMAFSYIAFTEQGHRLGNTLAQAAVKEGRKMLEKQMKKTPEKEREEKHEA